MGLSPFTLLIGMDVISLGDFHLANDGNTVFKFVIPPEESPNNRRNIPPKTKAELRSGR